MSHRSPKQAVGDILKEQVWQMLDQGETHAYIAAKIGRSIGATNAIIRRYTDGSRKIQLHKKDEIRKKRMEAMPEKKPKLPNEVIETAAKLVGEGMTIKQVAVEMNRSFRSVCSIIQTHTIGANRLRQEHQRQVGFRIREDIYAILSDKDQSAGDKLESIFKKFNVEVK